MSNYERFGSIISVKELSFGSCKLINKNILNTLHWLVTSNQSSLVELAEQLETAIQKEDSAKIETLSKRGTWLDEELSLQLPAFEAAQAAYEAMYKEEWVPAQAKVGTKRLDAAELVAKYKR